MAKRRSLAVANWKITVEVGAGDAYANDIKSTTIVIDGAWQRGPRGTGGPLGMIALDMGAVVKMLDDCGKLVPGGDAIEGFALGFTGEEVAGSQE